MMTPEKYRIFDQLIEGVQIIDPEWKYAYINQAAAAQGKREREDLLGFTMMECYPGIDQTDLFVVLSDCMTKNHNKEIVNEFRFPDGSTGYFLLRIEKIDEGILILSFDVTDQKRAELIIKRNNERLEDLVKTRTKELLEHKLLIEKQIRHLKELNSTKDKFFSIVAHDLMSPLISLKSLSTILSFGLENLDMKEINELNKDLVLSVDNTIKLANDLISWARIQMNQHETHLQIVNAHKITSEVFELYRESAKKKGVDLKYKVDENETIYGDKNQIAFIIRNLVNNALKFSYEEGKVMVSIKPSSKDMVLITVQDDGAGIPKEILSKIFETGIIKSAEGTKGERGTGLGLLLCNEFIKLNGGKIKIQSELNKGTTVKVWLPNKKPVNDLELEVSSQSEQTA